VDRPRLQRPHHRALEHSYADAPAGLLVQSQVDQRWRVSRYALPLATMPKRASGESISVRLSRFSRQYARAAYSL